SAHSGEGLPALLDALCAQLPESPPLYPEDDLSDRPLRFLAAELVREAATDALDQEVPYALAVEIEQFDESRSDLVRIRANLIVERASQKKIVIGEGGRQIKQIGIRARLEIEKLVDAKVHLELWVKVEPRWTKRPARVKALGYV
ncbi:MAG TPA: GTPase Era, partial [Myxococcota bacterium]|nr:GTPase Era [Myxococcota bacterium]